MNRKNTPLALAVALWLFGDILDHDLTWMFFL